MTLIALLLSTSTAYAGDALYDAASAGMGGADLADISSVSASLQNPALGAQRVRVDAEFLGSLGSEHAVGGAIVDSASSPVALALGMRWEGSTPPYTDEELPGWYAGDALPPNKKSITDLQAAFSAPIGPRDALSVGLGGTIARYDTASLAGGWTGNLSVGLALRASEHLTVGWSLRNPLPTPEPRPAPLTSAFAARYATPEAAVELDGGVRYDDRLLPDLRAGASVTLAEVVVLRAGSAWTDHLDLSGGVGIQNETGGFGWAMSAPVSGAPILHTFELWFHGQIE